MTLARASRLYCARYTNASVNAGSTRWCSTSSAPAQPSCGPPADRMSDTGKIGHTEANRMMRMMPVQNTGAE